MDELRRDLREKDDLIEDIVHDAYDQVCRSNSSEVRAYNEFLDEVEETCRQMRI